MRPFSLPPQRRHIMREGNRSGSAAFRWRLKSMADDERNSGGAGEPPHRRRMPPPTIDLEATDVSATGSRAAAPDEPAAAGEAPAASAAPDDAPKQAQPEARPRVAAADARRAPPTWSHAAAGALGAALVAVVAASAWALLGSANDQQADLSARLARIESQLGALSRPAAAPGDTRPSDDLAPRLARIESTLSERLAAVDREIRPLADRLADLGRRDDEAVAAARLARERADAAAKSLADVAQQLAQLNAARANAPAVERADLDALSTRLAGLEASTKQIGEQLGRIATASNPGNIRRAVVAL